MILAHLIDWFRNRRYERRQKAKEKKLREFVGPPLLIDWFRNRHYERQQEAKAAERVREKAKEKKLRDYVGPPLLVVARRKNIVIVAQECKGHAFVDYSRTGRLFAMGFTAETQARNLAAVWAKSGVTSKDGRRHFLPHQIDAIEIGPTEELLPKIAPNWTCPDCRKPIFDGNCECNRNWL